MDAAAATNPNRQDLFPHDAFAVTAFPFSGKKIKRRNYIVFFFLSTTGNEFCIPMVVGSVNLRFFDFRFSIYDCIVVFGHLRICRSDDTHSLFVVSHPVAKYPPNEVSRTSGRKRGAPRRRACTDTVVRYANLQSLHFYTAIISNDGPARSRANSFRPQQIRCPSCSLEAEPAKLVTVGRDRIAGGIVHFPVAVDEAIRPLLRAD